MEQYDRQFWQIVRSFLIRKNQYNRQKGSSTLQLEEFQQVHAKILAQQDLKQAVITKLMGLQPKSDYHNLIILAFLHELAKWSKQYEHEMRRYPAALQCLITQTIKILNTQQQFHSLVAKQNDLISVLLPLEITQSNSESFQTLYLRLKEVKEYFPTAIRQHQKKCFLTSVQEVIEKASFNKNIKIVEYIFADIFNELQTLQQNHQLVSPRLKIIKKIIRSLWTFHEEILYKLAYLLMKYSYHMSQNLHLSITLLPIYEPLLDRLLEKPNIAPLLLFKHIVFNNLQKALNSKISYILFEGLLSQLEQLFTQQRLEYFMRNYDWNYLQIGPCQQTLNKLYQYLQNRSNQKRYEYELIKLYLNRIHCRIKVYLQGLSSVSIHDDKQKFYQLKKKQYLELIQQMSQKPKKLFKRIQSIVNLDVRQATIQKYVRLVKKTAHLQNKRMIDIFSTDNQISAQLFVAYTELILRQCKQHNLQEFIRLFTSNFFISGQSQQIARVMDTLTQFYFKKQEKNNIILRSSDATYTFANAILILNTDLHNPKNQQKISEENFLKMCKKINEGEDIPLEILKKTYANIKKNKINTFRDRGNMIGISVSNWMLICTDYESLPLHYYDHQLQELDDNCFKYFTKNLLASILDEKQTSKLQLLVQRFVYEDKVFQCQIIEILRKAVDKKPHLPTHILQKIFEHANFKNSKISQKLLSYYWLSGQIILSFPEFVPTSLICQFLVQTWSMRFQVQDNMFLLESAQIKRIRANLKAVNKRETKKSIINMFSNFLSFKDSDEQKEVLPNQFNRRNNFKLISNNIFDIIKRNSQSKKSAIKYLLAQIHKEESKIYQQFVSCLFLTFNILYEVQNCEEVAQDLFYQLLGLKQSQITKRLDNLGKKDPKLYNILINYCKFWILKLLFKTYNPDKLQVKQNNTYEYLLNKSLDLLEKTDKQLLQDLTKQLLQKSQIPTRIVQTIEKIIKKYFSNESISQFKQFLQKFRSKDASQSNKQIQSPKKLSKQNSQTSETSPTAKSKTIETFDQGINQKDQIFEKEGKVIKKQSGQSIQAQIFADAIIDQIERQIESSHAKKSEGNIQSQKEAKFQIGENLQTSDMKVQSNQEFKGKEQDRNAQNTIVQKNQEKSHQLQQNCAQKKSIQEEKVQENQSSLQKSEETPNFPVILF